MTTIRIIKNIQHTSTWYTAEEKYINFFGKTRWKTVKETDGYSTYTHKEYIEDLMVKYLLKRYSPVTIEITQYLNIPDGD